MNLQVFKIHPMKFKLRITNLNKSTKNIRIQNFKIKTGSSYEFYKILILKKIQWNILCTLLQSENPIADAMTMHHLKRKRKENCQQLYPRILVFKF